MKDKRSVSRWSDAQWKKLFVETQVALAIKAKEKQGFQPFFTLYKNYFTKFGGTSKVPTFTF